MSTRPSCLSGPPANLVRPVSDLHRNSSPIPLPSKTIILIIAITNQHHMTSTTAHLEPHRLHTHSMSHQAIGIALVAVHDKSYTAATTATSFHTTTVEYVQVYLFIPYLSFISYHLSYLKFILHNHIRFRVTDFSIQVSTFLYKLRREFTL